MSRAAPTNADLMDKLPTCLTPLCQPPHPIAAWRLSPEALSSSRTRLVSNDEAINGTVGNTSLRGYRRYRGHNLLAPSRPTGLLSFRNLLLSVGRSTTSQPSSDRRRTEGVLQSEKYRFLSTGRCGRSFGLNTSPL
jgi:hypothetical protein